MRGIPLRAALALALGAALLAAPARPAPGESGGCRPWRAVRVPPADGSLQGISGTSSSDVWVVGELLKPRILHWNGTRWHRPPQDDPKGDALYDVEAIAPDDAWAVGYRDSGRDPLVMRWNGRGWKVDQIPLTGPYTLYGVDSVSSKDVWSVGNLFSNDRRVAMHWDGARWVEVPMAQVTRALTLFYGVAASSAEDVWAVGYQQKDVGAYPWIEHWDGDSWTVVEAASPPVGRSSTLYEVSAITPTDAWAVGWYGDPFPNRPMVQHWDGTSWSLVQTPSYPGGAALYGVEAIATDDVWAVGQFATLDPDDTRPITLHWDGTTWKEYPAPNPDHVGLLTVTEISPTEIWAAGSSGGEPFTIRSRGVCP